MGQRILRDMRRRRADVASANKLVWVSGAIMVVLFVGAISYAFYGELGTARIISQNSAAQTLAMANGYSDVAEKDTDGDGVPDWEELLWGTDLNKTDSDNDGVLDGEEQRNLLSSTGSTTDDGYVFPGDFSAEAQTATQIAAQELLGSYMQQVKQTNVDLTYEEQNMLVQQSVRTASELFQPPTVRVDDLVIVPVSQAAREEYITGVVDIFQAMGEGATSDYEAMAQLTGSKKLEATKQLVDSSAYTNKFADQLKRVPVPDEAADLHARFVSALLGYAYAVDSVARMEKDPVLATVGTQMIILYDELLNEMVDLFQAYGDEALGMSEI
jgi:hypothetical protein